MKKKLLFTHNDRIAILILITLILFVTILPSISISNKNNAPYFEDTSWFAQIQNSEKMQFVDNPIRNSNFERTAFVTISNKSLFDFDPNLLSLVGFINLGLRPKTAQTIINYRNKGGKFRNPEDLKKIYGLRADEFDRLKPYIMIKSNNHFQNDFNTKPSNNFSKDDFKNNYQIIIEINSADTTKWKMLNGIGSKLAARIVNFRNKLGGFYSIDQVGETYGVPDSTFQKIKSKLKINTQLIIKLDLNTASFDELNAHPYISYNLAKLIVNYRTTNGSLKSLNDLELLVKETKDVFEKLKHYTVINE